MNKYRPLSSTSRKMNQFAILYLMALFRISFAQPQEGPPQERHQIKEARFYDRFKKSSQMFNNGDVYLYVTTEEGFDGLPEKSYKIGDNSDEFSEGFDMDLDNTIVTDDGITVKFFNLIIDILTVDGNNIAFYQNLLSLEEFDYEYPVTRVTRGGETLEDVFAVKAKEDQYGEWIFAAVDNNGPRLIFPCKFVNWTREYEDPDTGVSFTIEHEPQNKIITIEFDKWTAAKTFHAFIDSRPIAYLLN